YQAQVFLLRHLDESAVVHLHHLPLGDHGCDEHIEQQQHRQHNEPVVDKGLFRCFYFFHDSFLSSRSASRWAQMAFMESSSARSAASRAKSKAYSANSVSSSAGASLRAMRPARRCRIPSIRFSAVS